MKRAIILLKEPEFCDKSLYILPKELYSLLQEPYFYEKSHNSFKRAIIL